jgi:hypothetical protein
MSSEEVTQDKVSESIDLELSIMENLEGLISQADQKAQFTLTVGAVLLASTTLLNTGQRIDTYLTISALLMILALAVSVFFSLLAVIPRLPPGNLPKNIFFFGSIIQSSEETFIEEYDEYLADVKPMILSEIYTLSSIQKKKLNNVRLSYIFLGIAIIIWIIGHFASLILG